MAIADYSLKYNCSKKITCSPRVNQYEFTKKTK